VENLDAKPVIVLLAVTTNQLHCPKKSWQFYSSSDDATETGVLLGFDFFTNPSRFWEALPIGAGIVAVLAAHELGHRLLARRHQVLVTPFSHFAAVGALVFFDYSL